MALLEPRQEFGQLHTLQKIPEKPAPLAEKDVADRLVYKLVRVEEDGTVVPATEDELIQMGSLLEGDTVTQTSKAENDILGSKNQGLLFCKHEESSCSKGKSSIGSQNLDNLEAEKKKLQAQLKFLDIILQKLKDEEEQRASSEGFNAAPGSAELVEGSGDHASQQISGHTDLDCKWDCKSEISPDISDDPGWKCAGLVEQSNHSKVSLEELESPVSTSKHSWMSIVGDSSMQSKAKHENSSDDRKETSVEWECDLVKGSVCLDNLSIRELHEAFRTTFGRQTSVKDKQWLKRRISMGLGGFHETTNNNVTLEGKAIAANTEGSYDIVRLGSNSPAEQFLHRPRILQAVENKTSEALVLYHAEPKFLDHKKRSRRGLHESYVTPTDNVAGHLVSIERKDQMYSTRDREGKRQRKPTKRYIEELAAPDTRDMTGKVSMKESNQEIVAVDMLGKDEAEEQTGPIHTMVSGIKFTTGYRGRRGRPKKTGNMVLACKSAGRAAQLVRRAISVQASRLSVNSTASQSRHKMKPVPDTKMENCKGEPLLQLPLVIHVEQHSALSTLKSSDADIEIVPTPKGGMRRKHHRPWTLREVMKLVEGVARCGVGKWAEIKKLAFSNSVYRTSVDLKDKWRNLLRASDTHLQVIRQGEHRRKHASAPIPGPVLVRVRELAAQQSQPVCVNLDSGISRSGRTVHKRHFL